MTAALEFECGPGIHSRPKSDNTPIGFVLLQDCFAILDARAIILESNKS